MLKQTVSTSRRRLWKPSGWMLDSLARDTVRESPDRRKGREDIRAEQQ